eukprot:6979092-Pyramimonas_sp.AAC.1
MVFDLITARHLDLSSIGYLLLPKSRPTGSIFSSHLDPRCRFSEDNSSFRTATGPRPELGLLAEPGSTTFSYCPSHLVRGSLYFVLSSSCRAATELIVTEID